MTRISLKEAYDNRDVIAQIAKLNDVIDNLPNPDLTNVVLKTGAQTIAGVKTFTDQVILAGGMDLSALGATTINGDLTVNGDIIQTGAAYETHAEQLYSHNDYIIMRDGAVNALPAGSYSGLQVKKYDGSADCRMVVDNAGIMRVGDINDEKPLAVRDEAADMTSGALVKWDGVNQKMIAPASNVGSDTQPVKIVDGEPVQIGKVLENTYDYISASNVSLPSGWIQTKICSLTLSKGDYLFIGQTDYLSGNGEITSGLIVNGVQRWLCQYNSTANNVNHMNFAYILNIPSDNTEVALYSYSENARTCDGVLISMKLI